MCAVFNSRFWKSKFSIHWSLLLSLMHLFKMETKPKTDCKAEWKPGLTKKKEGLFSTRKFLQQEVSDHICKQITDEWQYLLANKDIRALHNTSWIHLTRQFRQLLLTLSLSLSLSLLFTLFLVSLAHTSTLPNQQWVHSDHTCTYTHFMLVIQWTNCRTDIAYKSISQLLIKGMVSTFLRNKHATDDGQAYVTNSINHTCG